VLARTQQQPCDEQRGACYGADDADANEALRDERVLDKPLEEVRLAESGLLLKQRVDLPARLYVVTHLWHMIKCGTCEAWHMIKCGTCGRVAMVVVVVVMAGLVMVVALLLLVVVKLTVVG